MKDTTLEQLRSNVIRIVDILENPPLVLADDPSVVMEDNQAPCGEGFVYDDDEEVWRDADGEELETAEMSAYDYLQDALDIEYRVGADREYRSAEVLVGFGGPNLLIDTKTNQVHGYWGGDHIQMGYQDVLGIDDALEELFSLN